MPFSHIRNFVIIAHIDHGKSTLADRLLEVTGTVEARRMRPQYLDALELERERGITIKMAPVRMTYIHDSQSYILNLIDTPGHSDFSYEVSRALAAVEGAVLLVDVAKGIQAQTLSNLRLAKSAGLTIVGAVNKIDLQPGSGEKVAAALATVLECPPRDILRLSGKTGQGVGELLNAVVEKIPPPEERQPLPDGSQGGGEFSALVFNSVYDDHRGIVASVRVGVGEVRAGQEVCLAAAGASFRVKEVGCFAPEFKVARSLSVGEIGYVATGLKNPSAVKIGDTLVSSPSSPDRAPFVFPGYRDIAPVVFISFYPDGATKFEDLKRAFERLRLNDPALHGEPDANEALGRGLKVGFLGTLHFEITSDRLRREFGLEFLTSFPTIAYRVVVGGKEMVICQNEDWPLRPDKVFQPMIRLGVLTPPAYLNSVLSLKQTFGFEVLRIETLGEALEISARMPLAELIRDFDEQLKSCSAGYASFSYEPDGEAEAKVAKMEILVAGEVQPALTRIVARRDVEREARATVERLKALLPAAQFAQAVQAAVEGRIVARETIPALKKKLGDFGKNSGDRTRKMKLWKKQKKGKERLKATGRISVPLEVFREILKK